MRRRQREYTYIAIKKRQRRGRKKSTGRIFITLVFLAFLTLSSSLFFYAKNRISEETPEKTFSSSVLTEQIQKIDVFIDSTLFNLGLSIKDVKSRRAYNKIKDGIGWELQDTQVSLPPGVNRERVERTLEDALSKTEADLKFQGNRDFLMSEIKVYSFPTHKIRFDFYKRKLERRPEKVARGTKSFLLEERVKPKDRVKPPELASNERGIEKKFEKMAKDTKTSASKGQIGLKEQVIPPEHYRYELELGKQPEKAVKLTKPSFSKDRVKLREKVKSFEGEKAIKELEKPIFVNEKPKVVIIVDDLGLNKILIDKLLAIPARLNFAILPNLPYSDYAAEMAYRKGWDVILHQPMEPKVSSGYTALNAGDGVLFVGLSRNEILAKLENNLDSIPHVKGVNNHMGSKFTENSELMELVLQRLKSRGLFFVDSKTSENTTGFDMAKKLGMRAAERDVFLDQSFGGPNYVRSQIEKLVKISKHRGYAIGICHPYPVTIEVLSEMVPQIEKEVELVAISSVVN